MQHRLDRRATLLAETIKRRVDLYRRLLRPEGTLPPFMDEKTTAESTVFWRTHRYDSIGRMVLSGYSAGQIAELDAWLTKQNSQIKNRGLV
jgi:hypothetical protein